VRTWFGQRRPEVSVIVVIHNIPREATRTLLSLSPSYQRHIDAEDYEVIVVDNGSNPPLDPKLLRDLKGDFRLIRIDPAPPSPAHAVNRGLAAAKGAVVGMMIDGARIATPGLLHFARHGARLYEAAVVAVPGWYLGYDFQRWAILAGYDKAHEDALLASIDWPRDGYRLFEIGTLDESSVEGWLLPIAETNALFMRRELWTMLHGLDERFDCPGGGLVNLDTYARALELPNAQRVLLLGEGTFHQVHGGVATNKHPEQMSASMAKWLKQYEQIRGRPYSIPNPVRPPAYIGTLPRPALAHFVRSAVAPIRGHTDLTLGPAFEQRLWSLHPPVPAADPMIAALVRLAQEQFRLGRYPAAVSIARLARERAPNEPEPQRLLSLVACGLDQGHPMDGDYFLALGTAYQLLGDSERAAFNYRKALTFDRNLVAAHQGLATLRMPGDPYDVWLDRLYASRAPETVMGIGVGDGKSLVRVPRPALTMVVDPEPGLIYSLQTQTHIFPETSDEFFARRGPDALLAGRPLDIAFIGGKRLFEQALRDISHLEGYCGPRSMILLHNTVPLDEATQSRTRDTAFHTGDVWKTVLCIKHYRPDIDVFTIATPWSGLTVLTNLDPLSRRLSEKYEAAVASFIDLPYSEIDKKLEAGLNLVPNDWQVVEARLKARRVL
jgi:tetratricopeptide (TPR) repeat protein